MTVDRIARRPLPGPLHPHAATEAGTQRRAWAAAGTQARPAARLAGIAAATLTAVLGGPGAARAEPVTYTIDPTHTFVYFELPHFDLAVTRGRWNRKHGRITIDRAAGTGHAAITVDTASIDTGVAALDALLRGPSYFDSGAHPQARFVGERFAFEEGRVKAVSGTLTIRDRAGPVTLRALRFDCYTSPLFKRETCGGDFEATIQRSDWGLGARPDEGAPGAAPDRLRLLVQVEAVRQ